MSQTDDNFISSVTVHPYSLSDHHRIELKLTALMPAVQTNTITKRDFRNIDADARLCVATCVRAQMIDKLMNWYMCTVVGCNEVHLLRYIT